MRACVRVSAMSAQRLFRSPAARLSPLPERPSAPEPPSDTSSAASDSTYDLLDEWSGLLQENAAGPETSEHGNASDLSSGSWLAEADLGVPGGGAPRVEAGGARDDEWPDLDALTVEDLPAACMDIPFVEAPPDAAPAMSVAALAPCVIGRAEGCASDKTVPKTANRLNVAMQ